jgi:hypothetical protein
MDEHVVGHGEQVTLHARGQRDDDLQQKEIRLFIRPSYDVIKLTDLHILARKMPKMPKNDLFEFAHISNGIIL